jgi:hypothetical protein
MQGAAMIPTSYRSSRADTWSRPRPYSDPNLRYLRYGPIRPMDEDRGLLWRLFVRR